MTDEIQEHSRLFNGIRLNYGEIQNGGAPLVLLHGGSSRWQSFRRIMPPLAEHWHIYAPDFRGHGKSQWITGHYRLQDYTADTIAFLENTLREPALLFGHSLGGMVALLVAAQYPQGVRAVVFGDALLSQEHLRTMFERDRERMSTWKTWAGGQKPFDELITLLQQSSVPAPDGKTFVPMLEVMGKDWSGWETFATELYENDPDMMAALIDRFDDTFDGYDMEQLLPTIHCPVLLLQADPNAGGALSDREVAAAMPLLKHGKHVKISQVSHGLFHEKPVDVVQALESFYQSIQGDA